MKWLLISTLLLLMGAAPATQPAARWEYGVLCDDTYYEQASWVVQKSITRAKTMGDLEEKLIQRKSVAPTPLIETLSYLGDGGWEMIAVVNEPKGGRTWYFRRPK